MQADIQFKSSARTVKCKLHSTTNPGKAKANSLSLQAFFIFKMETHHSHNLKLCYVAYLYLGGGTLWTLHKAPTPAHSVGS